jgi:ferritin
MKIGAKMEKSINDQIQSELASAYLYYSMAAWCDSLDLDGATHWMKMQAQEELKHADRLFDYLSDRDGRVLLQPIPEQKTKWKNLTEVFEDILAHERMVTARFYAMVELATQEKDYTTLSELKWFLDEQVEEEDQAKKMVVRFRHLNDDPTGLFLLDEKLARRDSTEED